MDENCEAAGDDRHAFIQKELDRSRAALNILRTRIRCCWLVLVLALGCQMLASNYFGRSRREALERHRWERVEIVLYHVLWYLRVALLNFAPLINDRPFTIFIIASDMFFVLLERVITYCKYGVIRKQFIMSFVLYDIRGPAFMVSCVFAMCTPSGLEAQRRLWLGVGIFALLDVAQRVTQLVEIASGDQHASSNLGESLETSGVLIVAVLVACFAFCPKLHKRIQGKILNLMDMTAANRGAAILAGLIGSVPPQEALSTAHRRFRCLRHGQFSQEMLTSNLPNPAYSLLAQPCCLGSCDAFISHSWKDDGSAKWKALQGWSAAFIEEHGHAPTLWFDRCCIDQRRIDLDLRCLPVFLKGCKRLVVLLGPSYLSRLWCIVEIFTFVQMGGLVEDIEVLYVLRDEAEADDQRAIEESFDNFDARQCECSCPSDMQRIFAVLEAAFGSFDAFNAQVRLLTRRVRMQRSRVTLRVSEPYSSEDQLSRTV